MGFWRTLYSTLGWDYISTNDTPTPATLRARNDTLNKIRNRKHRLSNRLPKTFPLKRSEPIAIPKKNELNAYPLIGKPNNGRKRKTTNTRKTSRNTKAHKKQH